MRFRTRSLALFVAVLALAAAPPAASAALPIVRTLDSIAPSAPMVTYELHRMDSVAAIRIDSLAVERVTSLRGVTTSGALATTPTRALAQPAAAINQGTESIMTVRAKFTYQSDSRSISTQYPHKTEAGTTDMSRPELVEMRTLKFSPVYANNDPNHENTKFWNATPMGSIELGTVNRAAWEQFEIGKQYFVDFSPADQPSTLAALRETVAGDSAAAG